jgi:hypothetical protein
LVLFPASGFSARPFGFATLSATIGLFSEQAVLKPKHLAEMTFSKAGRGADSKPPTTVEQSDQDAL